MKIEGLRKYRPTRNGFSDLEAETQWRAERYLSRFVSRWRGNLPFWRQALLIACARRRARMNYDSASGRKMRAIKAGKRSRLYAIMGNRDRDPLTKARDRRSLLCKLRREKQAKFHRQRRKKNSTGRQSSECVNKSGWQGF